MVVKNIPSKLAGRAKFSKRTLQLAQLMRRPEL